MNYIMLFITICGVFLQNVLKKQYNLKNKNTLCASFTFNVIISFSALVFFLIVSKGNFTYHLPTILGAAIFTVGYVVGTTFAIQAIRYGSLSLTSLVISYSLIIPAIFGILFLHESFNINTILGILLLIISLLFIYIKKGNCQGSCPITLKWMIYAFLAFVGNGICSTMQKMHQVAFPSQYKNEFMIIAMAMSTVFCALPLLFIQKEGMKQNLQYSMFFAIPTGLANGVTNLLVMILSAKLPASFMFPVISAGGILVTLLFSVTVFKEKLSKMQLTGFAAGILSIILLNL